MCNNILISEFTLQLYSILNNISVDSLFLFKLFQSLILLLLFVHLMILGKWEIVFSNLHFIKNTGCRKRDSPQNHFLLFIQLLYSNGSILKRSKYLHK